MQMVVVNVGTAWLFFALSLSY